MLIHRASPANAADTITVVVNNAFGWRRWFGGHFGTLRSGASLPSDATCAAEIPWEREMVPDNSGTNSTMPRKDSLTGTRQMGLPPMSTVEAGPIHVSMANTPVIRI